MLNSRMTSILRELMKAETPVTSEYLAKVLAVTSRTVRNDIKELEATVEDFGASIKSIRGTGYQLEIHDDQIFRQLLLGIVDQDKENDDEIPTMPEDRILYVIKRLLLAEDYCKLDCLADEIFVSRSTLQNDLKDVKHILRRYGITLEKRPNFGLKVNGDEFKLRLCMADHLFHKFENDIDLTHTDLPLYTKEDLSYIRKVIVERISLHNISLSDIGLNNLIIHIAIAYHRIKGHKYMTMVHKDLIELKSEKQYLVAKEIVSELEKGLDISFPEPEIAYVTIHLLGTKMVTELHLHESTIHEMIDEQVDFIVNKVLDTIDHELNLGIKDDQELYIAICLHLKPAIHRYHYGINLPNPLIDEIKSKYPAAFQAAVIASLVIKSELHIEINENEIGYLALHLGAAIENVKTGKRVKRCLIVCASGVGSARLLASKVQSKFGDKVEIVGTTDYYKLNQISFHAMDFIISTIPISTNLPIPVIQVHTILGGGDFEKIEAVLNGEGIQKLQYLKEELVFLQRNFETREEVLNFLCQRLQSLGLVHQTFLESVLARERLSPTSYGNFVAIPHPITPQTESTFWTICTLKKPIDWGGKRVQFVCLLSVEKNSPNELQKMYENLVELIDHSQIVQQLIKCKTYKEFTAVFSGKR
ncbi:transcription antiterminator [Bacillus sp. BRMEA1]|uniref:BglG family transcription antiterminator n=1 Tax=Neobacillus endophyticus TaxID=2738405 RepID=UPI001563B322|nr:BglG family transcription antiterminator [Neobacillus endophyticus]NRD76314.1 transcription antiterminator [Neobacillus endophyticus]